MDSNTNLYIQSNIRDAVLFERQSILPCHKISDRHVSGWLHSVGQPVRSTIVGCLTDTSDTILYLSYFYTGKSLPIRLAWFWMSSQLGMYIRSWALNCWRLTILAVDIGVGFAAVGLVSMRGILGYEGWRWLFLIE